jgi:chitinase
MDWEQVSAFLLPSRTRRTDLKYLRYFSSAVASDKDRKIFANNILAAYTAFKLDGIDLDWEYPGRQGAEGNNVDSKDTPNFLSFLTILRAILPSTARISAAVQTSTFFDTEAHPMTDLTDFAQVLDWVVLMNYDVWGCKHAFFTAHLIIKIKISA